jgi:putative transposase
MNEPLKPKDQVEAIALFRAQVIAPLQLREYDSHGELAAALRELAAEPVRAPGYNVTRRFAVSTLQRWYYAFKKGGLDALKPCSRASGYGLALDDVERELLLGIRREHPNVSASLILRTLERDGRLRKGALSEPTLRRLYAAHGLDRRTLGSRDRMPRRRWEAAAPNQLWHTDVCHGPALRVNDRAMPLRIHALLDDHSRYVVAMQACATERESEMLALVVKALRVNGAPDVVYADNGPTYVGEALATACGRLGIGLVHAKPYDPEARGKMERFWRTCREQCLDHLGGIGSLHDVQVRLLAWLDRHYHRTAHSSLMGKTPSEVYATDRRNPVSDAMLGEALIVRGRRRVRRDGTVSVAGTDFEVKQGFLAGRLVTIGRSLLVPKDPPWLEHEEQRHVLEPVAPAKRRDKPVLHRARRGIDAIPFDPPGALLDEATGKKGEDR